MRKLFCLIFSVAFVAAISAQPHATFTRLVSFDGINGANPKAGLIIGSDGNLYGTTIRGGAYGDGIIFKMAPDGTLTTLFSFNGNNGYEPIGELVQGNDGKLYGTTLNGGNGFNGSIGAGTIFQITTDGTSFTNLHFFTGRGDGFLPVGSLALGGDGNFYGLTKFGGKWHEGSAFRISPNGSFETLASFCFTNIGSPDNGLVLGHDGDLYGTTGGGGKYRRGTVFKLTTNGILTTLASFNLTDGRLLHSKLVEGADGNFYGTTEHGGVTENKKDPFTPSGDGTFYKVTAKGILTTLASFNGQNGSHPQGTLVRGIDGCFYGTTTDGNTVFRVTTNGTIATLFSFTMPKMRNGAYPTTNGAYPHGLVQDHNGNLYGITILGGLPTGVTGFGPSGGGTIFRLSVNQ